jgi:hypothetical protein
LSHFTIHDSDGSMQRHIRHLLGDGRVTYHPNV